MSGEFWQTVSDADDEGRALRALRHQFIRRWHDAQIEALVAKRDEFLRVNNLGELRLRSLGTTKQLDDAAVPSSETNDFLRESWDRWLAGSRRILEEIFQSIFKVFMATLSDDHDPARWTFAAVAELLEEAQAECDRPSDVFANFTLMTSDEMAVAARLREQFTGTVKAQLLDMYTDAQVKVALTERQHHVPSLGALYGLRSRDPRSAGMIKELGQGLVKDIAWARNLATDKRKRRGIECLPGQILRQVKFKEAAEYIWGNKKHIGETEAAIEIISRRCSKSLTQATVGRYLREIAPVTNDTNEVKKSKKSPPAAKTRVSTPRPPGNK